MANVPERSQGWKNGGIFANLGRNNVIGEKKYAKVFFNKMTPRETKQGGGATLEDFLAVFSPSRHVREAMLGLYKHFK